MRLMAVYSSGRTVTSVAAGQRISTDGRTGHSVLEFADVPKHDLAFAGAEPAIPLRNSMILRWQPANAAEERAHGLA